mmetsp:Transcript_534/g.1541  ORF Transcript_534/g.1541 Transcript_534/m.1541 type:complete len:246 (+) Transcript_534:685-1422(+)
MSCTAPLKHASACGSSPFSNATWPHSARSARRRKIRFKEGMVTWHAARHAFAKPSVRSVWPPPARPASLRHFIASRAMSTTTRSSTTSSEGNAPRHSTKMPSCCSTSRPKSTLSNTPVMSAPTWSFSPSGERQSRLSCATRPTSRIECTKAGSFKGVFVEPHPASNSLAISERRCGRNASSSLSECADPRTTCAPMSAQDRTNKPTRSSKGRAVSSSRASTAPDSTASSTCRNTSAKRTFTSRSE